MRYFCIHFILILHLFLFFFSPYAFSNIRIQASDIDYYISETPSFSIIFSKNFLADKKKDFIHIYEKISYYDDIYKEVFPKVLKEKPIYVFASPKNQISNAVTSSVPFLRVLFFPSGVERMNHLAATRWEDTVIAHEMAHIFQLGQISDSLRYIRPIFKNSEVIFVPIPIFLNVNLAMPLFLLEGHAVLSESLFAPGGRLYSGSARALVLSQLKNNFRTTEQFIREYLINITEDTFSIEQQYTHGGYFFNILLQKYDIKKINNIFKVHAEHFIIPLSFVSVKNAFQTVLNTSFESLVNYYIQKYLPLAMQQNESTEEVLFKSDICPPFSKQDNKIFFLSSDLKSTPVLRVFDTLTLKWKKRKKTFSNGKVFKIKNRYYVSSFHKVSTTERVYGLFSEGMYLVEKYKSQNIQDIHNNQVLSINTSNNMNGFDLQLNGRFYDKINSPALFSPDGGIYYFKQEADQRVMYKDKVPLFQFRGFYGKPIEVGLDGVVYFIAATRLGSSLFSWDPLSSIIYRMSPSDVIIDAVKEAGNRFLICEIGPDSYSYKVSDLVGIPEQPAFYEYSFETVSNSLSTLDTLSRINTEQFSGGVITKEQEISDNIYIEKLKKIDQVSEENESDKTDTPSPTTPLGDTDEASHADVSHTLSTKPELVDSDKSYSSYHSLRHIRFNGIELEIFHDPITEYNGLINIGFRDPLEYSFFQLVYQQSLENWKLENWMLQTKYTNQSYRLAWNIQYVYKQGLENFAGSRVYSYIHEFSQGFALPLFRTGYWASTLGLKNAISTVELKKDADQSYYFSMEPSLQLQYGRIYSKNFDFHRQLLLKTSLQYHKSLSEKNSNFRLKALSYYTMHWGSEFYTTPFVSYQTALKQKSIPFRYFRPLNFTNSARFDFFLRDRVFAETNNYFSTGLQLQKFIVTPLYFVRYPFSLRSITPVLNGKYHYFLNNSNNKYLHFFEWVVEMKMGWLFHHKLKVELNLHFGYSSHPVEDFNFLWNSKANNTNKKIQHQTQHSLTGRNTVTEYFTNNSRFGIQIKSQF